VSDVHKRRYCTVEAEKTFARGTLIGVQAYLNVAEILISIVLMVAVLLQSRGGGLTSGSQDQSSLFRTRRGIEKTLFQFTLVLGVVFILVSIASSVVPANVG
jgi:preprotein translocase subunit SecG